MTFQRSWLFGLWGMIALAVGAATGSLGLGCAFTPAETGGPLSGTGGVGNRGGIGSTGGIGAITGAGGTGNQVGGGTCTNLACQQSTCRGTSCQQAACPGGGNTTISGSIFDPAGKVPLYNVNVYVPNAPLAPYTDGPICDVCETTLSGEPIVRAITDTRGLPPRGPRRRRARRGRTSRSSSRSASGAARSRSRTSTACTDTPLTDPNLTRLPRNQSRGPHPADRAHHRRRRRARVPAPQDRHRRRRVHAPSRAAGASTSSPAMDGTNAFNATLGGAAFTAVEPWWNDVANLNKYDIVLLSCEGDARTRATRARPRARRCRTTPTPAAASSRRTGTTTGSSTAPRRGPTVGHLQPPGRSRTTSPPRIDTSFPKGAGAGGLAGQRRRLDHAGASCRIRARSTRSTASGTGAQRWIYSDSPQSVQYLQRKHADRRPAQRLRQVVLSDIHVSSGGGSASDDDSGSASRSPPAARRRTCRPRRRRSSSCSSTSRPASASPSPSPEPSEGPRMSRSCCTCRG